MPVLGSNVHLASSTSMRENLPWPSSVGIVQSVNALPSHASRTTGAAVPPRISAIRNTRSTVIQFSAAAGSNDSLIAHIAKYDLGLRQRPEILKDGNCW